jgi:hypothetical protein
MVPTSIWVKDLLGGRTGQVIFQSLNDNLMVVILCKTAHNYDPYDAFHTPHPDGNATAMNRVLASPSFQAIFLGKSSFVPPELVVHEPRTTSEAQDRGAFPRDPHVIVWRRPWPRGAVEEEM